MDEKICLDTDFIINLIKNEGYRENFFSKYNLIEVYTTTINVFELFLRITNLQDIHHFLNKINILEFDKDSVILASEIYKGLKSIGESIEFRDIFIAAICIINNCKLSTLNKKHFSRIKNLDLL